MMRVLFIGYLGRGQTSGMRCASFQRLGYDVKAVETGGLWHGAGYFARQLGQQSMAGLRIRELNEAVLKASMEHKPLLVWAEKQEYLRADTLKQLKARGAVVVHYNPDPYFAVGWKQTGLADECLRIYDAMIVTKRYELEEYKRKAGGQIIYATLGYDLKIHVPPASPKQMPRDKVVFVGGWEPRRERLLRASLDLTPDVAVWGYGWRIAQRSRLDPLRALRLGRLNPGRALYFGAEATALRAALREGEGVNGEIYEERYAAAIAGSKVALGFLRKIYPDQHTTRTFEIPAVGGFMLADRSEEHRELFEEGKEAEYFTSDEEYRDKLGFYLGNESARIRIAAAGHQRCITSGYSYDDRIRTVLTELKL